MVVFSLLNKAGHKERKPERPPIGHSGFPLPYAGINRIRFKGYVSSLFITEQRTPSGKRESLFDLRQLSC
ncbi:hypothetical protein GCM10027182_22650 [Aquaspirillum soli]